MTDQQYDIVVLGGGPGGYTAAIRGAQLGMNVALVEREHLGGVCLNWGCIPTKSLLHTADVLREIKHAEALGLDVTNNGFDLERLVGRSRTVAGQLSKGVAGLMRKNGVTVVDNHGRLDGPNRVTTGSGTLTAEHIIIATGARAKDLPHIKADGELVWTAREAMTPTRLPERLLVIGAGAIGVEFASFYATLGSAVTLVEVLPQILPSEDQEIAAVVQQSFEGDGISVHVDTGVTALERNGQVLRAVLASESANSEEEFDAAILSVGVTGNVEDIGLDTTQASCDRGFIETDGFMQTGEPGLYAIGDVAGPPCLAHKASHEGIIAVEHIADESPHPLEKSRIPGCTYSHPQVASVGLTEAAAREAGINPRIGRFPLMANGKAVALGDTTGLVKTLFDRDRGELLGAHMVGPGVTELIQGFVVAMGLESTEAELMATVFPHPTLSEAMHESVLAAYDRTLNL
jgi:dihydrolipoamide dehydrogenase